MVDYLTEEEKEEIEDEEELGEKKEPEVEEKEEPEEEVDEMELTPSDIDAVPYILCSEDLVPMNIEDVESKEVEKREFIFKTSTENHMHAKYVCPECGKYFYHDMERQRQGCFIATAAYGTPFASDINVLRNFRDSYLANREWGKKFISLYYTISPPIARVIEKSETLRKIVRKCLVPVVNIFKEKSE